MYIWIGKRLIGIKMMINENNHGKRTHLMLNLGRTQKLMKFHGNVKILQNINK